MIVSITDAWTGKPILADWPFPEVQPYRFDQTLCTEPVTGIIHAFAITAALANRHPMSWIPTAAQAEATERMCESYAPVFRYSGD